MGCDPSAAQRAHVHRPTDQRRRPRPNPRGGMACTVGLEPAALGVRRHHRQGAARGARRSVAGRAAHTGRAGRDRAPPSRADRGAVHHARPLRPRSGDVRDVARRNRPRHRQRSLVDRRPRQGTRDPRIPRRLHRRVHDRARATRPIGPYARSSSRTAVRSPRSCTAAAGDAAGSDAHKPTTARSRDSRTMPRANRERSVDAGGAAATSRSRRGRPRPGRRRCTS